jgi:hypothetical protein
MDTPFPVSAANVLGKGDGGLGKKGNTYGGNTLSQGRDALVCE